MDYFILEIRHYLSEVINKDNKDDKKNGKRIRSISIYPIKNDVGRGEMTNCSISVAERAWKQTDKELNLIIDTNGGKRDMSMIQIAIIRALKTRGIEARNVLYSNFNRDSNKWTIRTKVQGEDNTNPDQQHTDNAEKKENGPVEIQDRSHEYGIFDVVSGIDEFVSYGRVERLQNYFETSTSGIKNVLNSVDLMCKAFMTCFTKDMIDSVVAVRDAIDNFKKKQKGSRDPVSHSEQYKLAEYVVNQIENDLHDVLILVGQADEMILPLINWCYQKKFYQQAITLYVDRMPAWYVASGVIKRMVQGEDVAQADNFYRFLYFDPSTANTNSSPSSQNQVIQNYQNRMNSIGTMVSNARNSQKKEKLLQELNNLRGNSSLGLDENILNEKCSEIDHLYNDCGIKKSPNNCIHNDELDSKPRNLNGYIHTLISNRVLLSRNDGVCISTMDLSNTYIKKKQGIQDLTQNSSYTTTNLLDNGYTHDDLLKILKFYLAFKILRNNSNHSNGEGGENEKDVCQWLQGESILSISVANLTQNSVKLDYVTTDKLLQAAIKFNLSLVERQKDC